MKTVSHVFSRAMQIRGRTVHALAAIIAVLAVDAAGTSAEPATKVRIATYNASLYGKQSDEIRRRLSGGRDAQAKQIAAVVQTIRPDVLLINEIDFDPDHSVARLLAEYFAAAQPSSDSPGKAIDYPHVRAFASNTGVDSGLDLNRNGRRGEPNDAWGYGLYAGQYAMAVFSRFPIDDGQIRTFRKYRWSALPHASRPVEPKTGQPYHDDATWSKLRLSSKNHIDVPIRIGGRSLHLLGSHPTPPVFDGDEDRNGCRNHDEIRFWIDYLGGRKSAHLVDDNGRAGGLAPDGPFVILGDLNADPVDGDGRPEAIKRLLAHPRVNDPRPRSAGGATAKSRRARSGDRAFHTASFQNGNLRLDYVLPSRSVRLLASGVHWPAAGQPGRNSIEASDHRLVWIDVSFPVDPE